MGFRVANKSCFTFATDLPPAARNTHPSGVLHAFRNNGREEHTFAWITNSLHIELAIHHLEKFGFDRSYGIVFIPYSNKGNWLDRYPHAAPALETQLDGKVTIYLNWRPYANGLSELGEGVVSSQQTTAETLTSISPAYNNENIMDDEDGEKKKRVYPSRAINMVRDNSFLANAEREELHIEIYNYLSWLHDKLAAIDEKNDVAEAAVAATEDEAREATLASEGEAISNNETADDAAAAAAAASVPKRKMSIFNGVDLTELQNAVSKLEAAFAIIPNVKFEEKEELEDEQRKGAPFLEEVLPEALKKLVNARELAGKPRRSKKRGRRGVSGAMRSHPRVLADFDVMFQRLVQYKEEHGDCIVSKNYKEDVQLANWVRGVREKKAVMTKKGIEVEEVQPGRDITVKTLNAERLERLNSIDFAWVIAGPKMSWEDRFKDLMEYYEMNGKWPSQSMGSIGEWVHKQRTIYSRKDPNYMKTKAPRLDAVGFEWTPRGNTRMSWDEGFEMLMEFGRINGHFDIPTDSEVDKKSDAHRLYRWVESLHDMYRSYKIGRQSGSLSDERVVLLIKHGFVFRNY